MYKRREEVVEVKRRGNQKGIKIRKRSLYNFFEEEKKKIENLSLETD